ncbi:hypothetical protein MPDQ_008188 [Monascus purpureus]|uniref:Uncharacterized protein n=1 Tax=Monascus purpureus TaxID=5098 RepID=A0A507QQI1_MONPU|nr:hypothetical protein MPDQ_008188 [Monascus purpureus]
MPRGSTTLLSTTTVIATGSNTGLGFECNKQPLDLGLSRLIIPVRSEAKGEEAYIEDGKAVLYRPEGEKIAGRLWEETMNGLAFAGVHDYP